MKIEDWILPWRARRTIRRQNESLKDAERLLVDAFSKRHALETKLQQAEKALAEDAAKINEIRKWIIATHGLGAGAPAIKLFGQR